jgi:ankyrin repeat protein
VNNLMIDTDEDVVEFTRQLFFTICEERNPSQYQRIRALIRLGADPNGEICIDCDFIKRFTITPIFYALAYGRRDIIALLITNGADINRALNKNNETLLMLASSVGDKQLVKLLIKNGVQLNAQTKEGYTALMCAAVEGHEEIVQLLVKAGADMFVTNKYKETALFIAGYAKQYSITLMLCKYMRNTEEPEIVLAYAVMTQDLNLVKILLQAGTKVTDRIIRNASRTQESGTRQLILNALQRERELQRSREQER